MIDINNSISFYGIYSVHWFVLLRLSTNHLSRRLSLCDRFYARNTSYMRIAVRNVVKNAIRISRIRMFLFFFLKKKISQPRNIWTRSHITWKKHKTGCMHKMPIRAEKNRTIEFDTFFAYLVSDIIWLCIFFHCSMTES